MAIPEYDKECDCEVCKEDRKERDRLRYIKFCDSVYIPPEPNRNL